MTGLPNFRHLVRLLENSNIPVFTFDGMTRRKCILLLLGDAYREANSIHRQMVLYWLEDALEAVRVEREGRG